MRRLLRAAHPGPRGARADHRHRGRSDADRPGARYRRQRRLGRGDRGGAGRARDRHRRAQPQGRARGAAPRGWPSSPSRTRADPRDALVSRTGAGARRAAAGQPRRHLQPAPRLPAARRARRSRRSRSCAATSTPGCARSPRGWSTRRAGLRRASTGSGLSARITERIDARADAAGDRAGRAGARGARRRRACVTALPRAVGSGRRGHRGRRARAAGAAWASAAARPWPVTPPWRAAADAGGLVGRPDASEMIREPSAARPRRRRRWAPGRGVVSRAWGRPDPARAGRRRWRALLKNLRGFEMVSPLIGGGRAAPTRTYGGMVVAPARVMTRHFHS